MVIDDNTVNNNEMRKTSGYLMIFNNEVLMQSTKYNMHQECFSVFAQIGSDGVVRV